MREWLQPPRIAMMSTGSAGHAGYGVARRCREGSKVGPLFADDMDTALALMAELAGRTAGEALHIDVPATQIGFTAVLQAVGMVPGFATTRMYRGGKPGNAPSKVFGITTLELG
ncbi:MAG: hypothetical protein E5X92_23410 [Mesorhizobium sp.]|nr:MAG: hypothetical protein E5Y51_22125 [Mesorhizobium sp.]TIO96616.1 MAG: hypothetical protein E5X92_23410 [Mesorhizobium sp.]TIS17701.1 MAG: hypothetical protein E5X10_02530 [Mesorhizobium sp.]TIU84690.1 MAG: hypothetical protein E5W06_15525 [Mesorhizobium sp.]